VRPPHSLGIVGQLMPKVTPRWTYIEAASTEVMESGMGKTNRSWALIWVEYPP